ncbi:MAG: NfeD family protein [Candidatus Thalassarchaeaceae archaeon]|nr:NfeD family protein [Candidatus Thalassarchaeaceae archaeon]MDP6742821.1 NfeD family protein [Candidatus Thalassarchaeaceae archaeon]
MIQFSISDTIAELAPTTLELIFLSCAILGGAFFIIMMILMFVGDVLGGVVDTAFDTDFTMDSDLSFEIFSLQGLAAAIMMFGFVGMYTIKSTETEVYAVIAGGVAAALSMYAVSKMMQGISKLQVDGTMQIKDAIGESGQVYSRIRPNESGEVQVVVDGTLRTLAAKAKDKTLLISTGTFIKVVDVIGSTLIVEELSEEE